MRIHIIDDIYVSSEGRAFTIERKTVPASGKKVGMDVYTPIGDYSTLRTAIKSALLNKHLATTDATTIRELLEAVERIEARVDDLVTL